MWWRKHLPRTFLLSAQPQPHPAIITSPLSIPKAICSVDDYVTAAGLSIGSLLPLRLRFWPGRLLFRPLDPRTYRQSAHLVMQDVTPFLSDSVHGSVYHVLHAPRPRIMGRNGHVAAIIDWGMAGWDPEYMCWERPKTHYTSFVHEDWHGRLNGGLLPSYETELAAEKALWRRLPEAGTA